MTDVQMKPLLVGEANPYGGDPYYALFPEPENSAGGRLCRRILGLTRREYLDWFDRVNLCPCDWSMRAARSEACRIEAELAASRTIVLLGAKVATAFDVASRHDPYEPFTVRSRACGPGIAAQFVVLPHPSGRSRAWNSPGSIERARAVLRAAGVPLGA